MKVYDALVRQRAFVIFTTLLLAGAGVVAAISLPSSIYPELTFARITLVAQGTQLGAQQQVLRVTRPIEEAVNGVPGLERVRSNTIRGASEVSLFFAPQTDMVVALQQVEARVSQIRAELPPELTIQIERLLPSNFPILTYNLIGGEPARLYDIARYQIRPALAGIPGLGTIEIQAGDIPQVEVVADPARLATAGLTYADLDTAIASAIAVDVVGRVNQFYRQYLVLQNRQAVSLDDVRNVVLKGTYRVRDVATVRMGIEDRVRIIRGDGKPAVLINISRQPRGNSVAVTDSVARVMDSLRSSLPPGIRIEPVYDQALLVRAAVRSVEDAIAIGAGLVVIVLFAFLRHGRITAISAASIPLTLAITIFAMKLVGATFNLMTLGGMAIAVGLVIDDAVVVTENITRHMAIDPNRHEAIRAALAELIWPVTTSTLTTVVVLLPLRLLHGVVGQFFAALSLALMIAVLLSLILSFTWVPILANRFVEYDPSMEAGAEYPTTIRPGLLGIVDRFAVVIDRLSDAYAHSLGELLGHARLFIIVAVFLGAAGWALHRVVGTGFLPVIDEGAFVIDYKSPVGTSLAETDRMVHQVEELLAATPEVTATSRRTGAEMGLFATPQNEGDIVVRLEPRHRRRRDVFAIIDGLRRQIEHEVPRLPVEFVQILTDLINDLAGNPNPIEIKLLGDSVPQLESYATRLATRIEGVPGVVDLFNGVTPPSPELLLRVDPGAAGQIGLTPEEVASQARAALLGSTGGQVVSGERAVDVRVRTPDLVRFDALRLGTIPIFGRRSNVPTPLAALATFKDTASATILRREHQRPLIAITASIERRSLGAVTRDIQAAIAAEPPPSGVQLIVGGQAESQRQAFHSLVVALMVAALLVVAVMLVQFESFVEPLVILLAAPLSFAGAILLLVVTRTDLNVSSIMGLVLLVGLVVKNGIILLDFTRRRMRLEGATLAHALEEAGRVRLRPILMTTLATLFGLLPLALGIGAGSEIQRPLALAVIGGLAISTPITLFIVPSLVVAIRGRDWRLS